MAEAGTVLDFPAIIQASPSAVPGRVALGVAQAAEDIITPTIGNYSPAPGSIIAAADPIFFDVTDNSGLFIRVLIMIKQSIITELVHDGDEFVLPYSGQSLRENIAGGFRYRVRRSGGWASDVTPTVFAYDLAGNELAV
jgi:hypothetical protein